ncbi:MAG: diguanylate cyclase domain-containing protein [Candidatus Methylumidiphilus sp.]
MKTLLTENLDERECLKALRVLYVEDDLEIRSQLEHFLARRVGALFCAGDGGEGLDVFRRCQPDIVITDLQMPVMNGLEMIEAIKELAPHTPVIITTAFNETHYLLKAIDLGVDAYVVKPINSAHLERDLLKCARSLSLETAFRAGNHLLRLLLSNLNEAVLIIDLETREICYCNRTAETLFGYTQDQMLGRSEQMLHADGQNFERFFEDAVQACVEFGCYECQGRMIANGGAVILSEHMVRPVFDSANQTPQLVHVIRDLAPRQRAGDILAGEEQRPDCLAHPDPLTGLANRHLFQDGLAHALARAKRHDAGLAVLVLGLDDFGLISDRYGHGVGEELLRATAARLQANMRGHDKLGHFGGGEFGVAVEDLHNPADAAVVAGKLRQALAEPVVVEGQTLVVAAHVGVSVFPGDGEDARDLIERANWAMRRDKSG